MHEKNVLAFYLVEHHVIREKGRIGKDQVVNFLRTDVPSSHYRARDSQYVFTSQRETLPTPPGELDGWRLGEAAIHDWFKQLKATATEAEVSFIRDVTFHDLRHDFAHRAKKEAGLDDGELAVYLGHITKRGTPAIQTTARYTQPSMDQIREKLKGMKGR